MFDDDDDKDPRIDPVDEMLLLVLSALCFTVWGLLMLFLWR